MYTIHFFCFVAFVIFPNMRQWIDLIKCLLLKVFKEKREINLIKLAGVARLCKCVKSPSSPFNEFSVSIQLLSTSFVPHFSANAFNLVKASVFVSAVCGLVSIDDSETDNPEMKIENKTFYLY